MRDSVSKLALLLAMLACPATAYAQQKPPLDPQAESVGVQEIIVTAQRRSERLQDVPIAITAVSSGRLATIGATGVSDIATLTPSLNVPATQAYFQPRLRGVGTLAFGPGIENPIATYIDGVYLALANSSLLSFSDVERVEVLKGPQGTLFGRNATGGLIQIITRDPKAQPGGSFDVGYGNYNKVSANASLHGGSDQVSGIVTGFYRYQGDGYGTNFTTSQDTNRQEREYGVRAKLMLTLSDRTRIRLSGDYVFSTGTYPDLRTPKGEKPLFGPVVPGSVWDTNTDYQSRNRFSGGGASLNVEQDVGNLKLVSITAYRKSVYSYNIDYDASPNPFLKITNHETDRQFSQELQLGSGPGSSINWIVGGYYFYSYGAFDPSTIDFAGPVVGVPPVTRIAIDGNQKSTSWAGFGQVTVPLGKNTRLTGGLRYTTEKRTLASTEYLTITGVPVPVALPFAGDDTFNKLTFRVSLDHKFTSDVLAYASFNRGFKSGGFNIISPGDPGYSPETLDAYEAGLKADLFNRRVRFNPAIFYYDYLNIQLPFFTPQGQVGIANGPSARLYGADVDIEVVLNRNFHVFGGASYVHSKFGSYLDAVISTPVGGGAYAQATGDATGNSLPFTSKFSGNIGAEYKILVGSGNVSLAANYYFNDGYYLEVDNRARQGSFDQLSASLGWTSANERLSLRVWGKNLTNSEVYTQFSTAPQGRGASYQPPRTYGITLGSKF